MRRGSSASRCAELKAEADLLKLSVQAVEFDLGRLGKQKIGQPPDVLQMREALRRKKASLLIDFDNLIRSVSQQSSNNRRIVQGPKSGVRFVAQGGSLGSGKRA